MDTGVNVNDVGTLAGLRGISGYGYNNHGNFAGDGSAINANVTANRDMSISEAINRTSSDQFLSDRITQGDSALNTAINTGNQFLSDRIWSQGIDAKFAIVKSDFASMERLAYANAAEASRQFQAIQLKQAECCCETKAGLAAIEAKLDCDRAAEAERENTQLRTQIQIINQGRGNES